MISKPYTKDDCNAENGARNGAQKGLNYTFF